MPSGPHLQLSNETALQWVARADCVKAIDDPWPFAHARRDALLDFRCYVDNQGDWLTRPVDFFNLVKQRLKGLRVPGRLYVEGLNEISRADILKVIAFYQVFVPLCHTDNLLVVGPNCATGDYEQSDWLDYRNVGWMGLDAIGIHAYFTRQYGFTQWNALRWRSYYDPLLDRNLPIFVNECGFDVVRDGPQGTMVGYKGWQLDPVLTGPMVVKLYGNYARQLMPREHAFFFTAAPNNVWLNYTTDPLTSDLIKELHQGGAVPTPTPPVPAPSLIGVPGIDVASYQGAVDWPLVARSGRRFAFVKATEGTTYTNPTFAVNWPAIKAAGMVRGAYAFGRPSRASGHDDARYFLAVIGALEVGDLLALDLEDTDVGPTAGLHGYALDFLKTVEAAVGFRPLLYTGAWYAAPHDLTNHADLAQYGLWLADYDTAHDPAPLNCWPFIAIRQYASQNRIPGIAGAVDENVANVASVDQLKRYGKLT